MITVQKKLQVFISSTYSDLINERQAVVEAVLRAGHIPAGMELFAAGSESQLEIIKRWIDTSDIYMVLLGGRYGSVEPNSGLSYTELEYRYALEQNKPLFAVILSDSYMDEKVKNHGKSIIELKERAKLESFTKLVEEKISKYANDKNEIRLAVLESVLDIQTRYSLKGWIREDQTPNLDELLNQIIDLKERNRQLESQVKSYSSGTSTKIGDYTFDELKIALQSIEIKVPNKVSKNGELIVNAYDMILAFQQQLSLGVSNKLDSSAITSFLYFSVCPHLRIYELTEIVKVSNVQWTTFHTSKLGNKFISLANVKGEKSRLTVDEESDESSKKTNNMIPTNNKGTIRKPSRDSER